MKNWDKVGEPKILKTSPEITIIEPDKKRDDIVTTWITQNLRSDSTTDIGRSPVLFKFLRSLGQVVKESGLIVYLEGGSPQAL